MAKKGLTTQTKCTYSLIGLVILEIMPIPFTAIYSLFVIRRRPDWLPGVVERLYADRPPSLERPEVAKKSVKSTLSVEESVAKTRKKCTRTLALMFLIDVIVPFTVPFGIYIVRRRPLWFKGVVERLYADRFPIADAESELAATKKGKSAVMRLFDEPPEVTEARRQKYLKQYQGTE